MAPPTPMPKANPPNHPNRFIASNRPISKPRSLVPERSATTARLEARIAPLEMPKRKFIAPSATVDRVVATRTNRMAAPAIPPNNTGSRPYRSAATPERRTVLNSPTGAIALTSPTTAVSFPLNAVQCPVM